MAYQKITHAILGTLNPVQGPFATYFHEKRDDFDLSLYTEGAAWLIKIEIDYDSIFTHKVETVEKELALDKKYLEKYGRGGFVNKFEELFDGVAKDQLSFLPITTIIEVREGIMHLLTEAYSLIDQGADPDNVMGL